MNRIILFTLVIFSLVLFGCAQEPETSQQETKQLITETKVLTPGNEQAKNTVATFTDNQLKLSFDYPENWGPVKKITKENFKKQAERILLTFSGISDGNILFLDAVNPDIEVMGRGGYWGDAAKAIKGIDDIKNYCLDKDNCSIFTNNNGVIIAKHLFITGTEGGSETDIKTAQYYFYNQNSEFTSFAMSYVRIFKTDEVKRLENKFEQLIESVKFID